MEIDREKANAELAGRSAEEVIRWGIEAAVAAGGKAVVTTNFRPYEAVILDLVKKAGESVPVLWVDHGHNRPATYTFAEKVIDLLSLEVERYRPLEDAAVPDAVNVPEGERTDAQEDEIRAFSDKVKLEPFRRGMKEMAPTVWFTALRRSQNQNRAGMEIVEEGPDGVIKVNPILEWNDQDMENYLAENDLPNEWDYFDPAKAGEKRECGLHNGELTK